MANNLFRVFFILTFTIFLSTISSNDVWSQSLFKDIEVILISPNSISDIDYIDYTATNSRDLISDKKNWHDEIKEEINYKIRMAQLDTETNQEIYPNRHLILNISGEVNKFSTNVYYYTGHITIGQYVKTLESNETVYTTTWFDKFSGQTNNIFEAKESLIDDFKDSTDDLLKEYFEAN